MIPFVTAAVSGIAKLFTRRSDRREKTRELRHRNVWQRQNARALIVGSVREWHRHTRRNWVTLRQMLDEIDTLGIPLGCHVEKLRYVDDHMMFEHDRLFLLTDAACATVRELRAIIRNANLEIDELARAVRTDDVTMIKLTAELVLRKFQFLFVDKLPSIVEPADHASWPVDGKIDPRIRAARQQEKIDFAGRGDIVYRPPNGGP